MRVDVDLFHAGKVGIPFEMPSAIEVEFVFVFRPVGGALATDATENIIVELPFEIERAPGAAPGSELG